VNEEFDKFDSSCLSQFDKSTERADTRLLPTSSITSRRILRTYWNYGKADIER
jgi:hypothetical protein